MKEAETIPTTLSGTFKMPFRDDELVGRLKLDGEASFLEVAGKGRERVWHGENCILGHLTDHRSVSLINCPVLDSASGGYPDGRENFRMRFFPHYVIRGDVHLRPDQPVIRSMRYEFNGARILFRKTKNAGYLLMDNDEFNAFIERHGDKHQVADVPQRLIVFDKLVPTADSEAQLSQQFGEGARFIQQHFTCALQHCWREAFLRTTGQVF